MVEFLHYMDGKERMKMSVHTHSNAFVQVCIIFSHKHSLLIVVCVPEELSRRLVQSFVHGRTRKMATDRPHFAVNAAEPQPDLKKTNFTFYFLAKVNSEQRLLEIMACIFVRSGRRVHCLLVLLFTFSVLMSTKWWKRCTLRGEQIYFKYVLNLHSRSLCLLGCRIHSFFQKFLNLL